MFGPVTSSQIDERKQTAAAREGAEMAQSALLGRSGVWAGGLPEVEQDGTYDADGKWVHYLRCGDTLDSGGCAP